MIRLPIRKPALHFPRVVADFAMKTAITPSLLVLQPVDACVVFCIEKIPLLPGSQDPAASRLGRMIRGWIKTTGYRGRANETGIFPSWETLPCRFVILAGLGPKKEFHIGRLEKAMASASRTAKRNGLRRIAVSLESAATPGLGLDTDAFIGSVVTGLYNGYYRFIKYLSSDNKARESVKPASLVFTEMPSKKSREAKAALRRAQIVSEALSAVKDIANLPANEANPDSIAAAARALAKKHGLHCQVYNRAALKKQGCNALLAVGQGSRHAPCMIVLKHPGTHRGLKPVVVVGKTITFDTGGISLKPAKSMEWMKYDKCGGMAVLAAMSILAQLRIPRPVIGVLAVAENMPDGGATKPGDIVKSRSGKTIEILNTDAEGRLVLADALSFSAGYKPAAIVDLATLTGAVLVALGHLAAAILSTDESLTDRLKRAGEKTGERLWPLPLFPEYSDDIRGQFADLKNVGSGTAGTIIGGAFLKQFVPENTPWAHIDIAGTAWEEKDRPYGSAGATLFGARLLVEWISRMDQ